MGHPNVCLVSYFGLPCSNKASFDRNLKKNKQMYTMENGKMMRGQQNPIKIPENVFPPTHSSSPSPQFEAPTYLRTTSTGQCNSYPIRNVFYSSNLLLYNEVSVHKNYRKVNYKIFVGMDENSTRCIDKFESGFGIRSSDERKRQLNICKSSSTEPTVKVECNQGSQTGEI